MIAENSWKFLFNGAGLLIHFPDVTAGISAFCAARLAVSLLEVLRVWILFFEQIGYWQQLQHSQSKDAIPFTRLFVIQVRLV